MSTFDLNSRLYAMYCFQSFNLASKRSEQRKKAIFNFYVENSIQFILILCFNDFYKCYLKSFTNKYVNNVGKKNLLRCFTIMSINFFYSDKLFHFGSKNKCCF